MSPSRYGDPLKPLIDWENTGSTRRTLFLAIPAVLVLAMAAFAPTASAAPSPAGMTHCNVPICSAPVSGDGACDAIRHDSLTTAGRVAPNATAAGYGPADLQSAYNLPPSTGQPGQRWNARSLT